MTIDNDKKKDNPGRFGWPSGAKLKFHDENGKQLSSAEFKESVRKKAQAIREKEAREKKNSQS